MATAFLEVKNRAVSLLAATISDSDLALDVTAGEGALFPSSFPFHITVDDEILSCTNRTADTLTVTRAQQGTAAAAHSAGVVVAMNITAKHLSDLYTAVNALEAARAIWVQPHFVSGAGAVLSDEEASNAVATFGDNTAVQDAKFSFPIPAGFGAITKAVVVVHSGSTADLRWNANANWGNDGETHDATTDSIAEATRAMTTQIVDELDVSAALAGIAAGDYVGLQFLRQGDDGADTISTLHIHGLLLEYSV